MARALGAQAGFVARLLPGEPLTAVRTMAVVAGSTTLANFDYALEASQRASLAASDSAAICSDAAARFGKMSLLARLGAQAYVWQRLDDADGKPVGLLSVVFAQPLADTGFITSVLRIFAARAAAEMERLAADARIRSQTHLLDEAQDAIIIRDMDGNVLFWNKGAERLYGWTAEEAMGIPALRQQAFQEMDAYDAAIADLLENGKWSGEFAQWNRHGQALVVEARWTLLRDDKGRPATTLSINTDITARKAYELQRWARALVWT